MAARVALRVSAFDELRRKANQGLRQEMDRYADTRLERFRKKTLALDVRALSNPGFLDPQREIQKLRDRAALGKS